MGALIIVTGPHPNGYIASVAGHDGLGKGATADLALADLLLSFPGIPGDQPGTVLELTIDEEKVLRRDTYVLARKED